MTVFHSTIKITLLSVCFIGFNLVYAQNPKTYLESVSEKVKSYDNIEVGFTFQLNNSAEGVSQKSNGNITLQGEKYLLNMYGNTLLFDGKYLHTISPEDEEVDISIPNQQDEQSITPSKMLTFYEEGYTYKMDIQQTIAGRKIQYIKLTPIDTNAEIKHILLGIDALNKHVYKLIQTDSKGTKYTLTINSFKTNQPLPETFFVFDEDKYDNLGYYISKPKQ